MMKTILLTCLFTLSVIIGFAQNIRLDSLKHRSDSLKHELTISRPDTNRVLVLVQLINLYKFSIPDSAFFYGQQALGLSRQIKFPKGEARSLFLLALTYRAMSNSSKALELVLKSMQIADKNKLMYEKANALTILGSIYLQSQNYSKALFYLHQAPKIWDSYPGSVPMALNLNYLANTYLSMNKLDSAEYYSRLMTNYIRKYNVDGARSSNLRTIGYIHYKKGETRLALDFLRQSLIYQGNNSQTGNYSSSAETSYEIANIYQQTNRLDSAIQYAQKSLADAQKGKSYSSIVAASSLLAELYEPKDAQKTIGYNKITIAAQDSLNNFSKTNAFKNTSEFDEKERQYEIETAQIAYKNQIRQYALLAGLGLFLLIAFILYRNNKKQQEANNLLHQQKEEINATLSQLKSTQTQLIQSEKMASLGELTAGIAHEIQNPLNFVNNFSEVSMELIEEVRSEKLKAKSERSEELENELLEDISQNLQKISHHGKRADSIVKSMLQHSRSGSGQQEETDLNALADEYLRLSYHGLRAKDKSFNAGMVTHYGQGLPKILVMPQDIGRVLLNLFTNAFYSVTEKKKQMPHDFEPTVTVSTEKTAEHVQIRVRDNGAGISQAIINKIMQPFFTTKPTGEGTGLGLSMSYDIIRAHGGELKVESQEGEFAEFIIKLPLNS